MFEKVRARMKRRQRVRRARAATAPLREFIYVDEVSVYSLLSSRQGALASEYTDTRMSAFGREIGGTTGVSAPIAKAELSAKLTSSDTQTSQVVRKSTIQAAFKEPREGEEERLALRPIAPGKVAPRVNTVVGLTGRERNALFDEWIIDPRRLTRGQLVEIEIDLDADPTFKITSTITAMLDILRENPELFPQSDSGGLLEAAAVGRVLDNLLVGLVPLRCRVVDYRMIELGGRPLLIHEQLLAQLPQETSRTAVPLHVVGVTEQKLFWKDLRRVLSHSRGTG